MKKQALSLAVMVAGAYPVASNALSLGDIESNSNLNQPLRAKIELLSASAADAKQLQVRLAPNSVFSRVGVDRPAFLNNLRFTSTMQNGKPVILVTSDAPITEPFVNFLLEVSWPKGQLLKEYTVMLNPPVLMQPGAALAGNEASVRAEPRATGAVNRPAPQPVASPSQVNNASQQAQQQAQQRARQQQQAAAQARAQQQQRARQQQQAQARQQQQRAQQQAQQPRQQAQQRAATPGRRTYRVQRGDTLFKIATRLQQPGVNVDQMMMALYRANPKAFIKGNINGLRAGAVLQAPNASAAKNTSRAQARRQVRQQYAEWKKFRTNLASKTVPQKSTGKTAPANKNTKPATKTASTQGNNDKARLEVLGKTDKANSSGAAAGSEKLAKLEQQLALARESMVARQRENKELKSRVTDLESMLRKKNRLIALRDDQLAQLQKQLADAGVKPAAPKQVNAAVPQGQNNTASNNNAAAQQNVVPRTQGETRPVDRDMQNNVANAAQAQQNKVVRAQQQPAVNNNQNNSVADQQRAAAQRRAELERQRQQQQKAAAEAQQQKDTQEQQAAPPDTPFADQQNGENDIMSLLTSPMAWKIGAGALFSLLLLWLLSRLLGRRKAAAKKEPAVMSDDPVVFDNDRDQAATALSEDEQSFRDLEKELDKAERDDDLDDPFGMEDADTKHMVAGSPEIVEAKADQDEDEVLMEANVYIAYGLHQQAESELKKALEKHPERLDYRHKLLENYFASNNRAEFDEHAQAYLATPGANKNSKHWQEIAEWGRKISPDNKLYTESGDSGSSGVAAAGAAVAAGVAAAGAAAAESLSDNDDLAETVTPGLDDLDDSELGLDDFDFDLDELESELGDVDEFADNTQDNSTPAAVGANVSEAGGQELVNTVDDDQDFSLDDLMGELQDNQASSELTEGTVPNIQNEIANEVADVADANELDDSINFDELLSGSSAEDNTPPPSVEDDGDGISLLGGLAAGAAAAAGATAAAVMSGKEKISETLSGAGDKVAETVSDAGDAVDNALDFDTDLPELPDVPENTAQHSGSELDFDMDLPELGDASADLDFPEIGEAEAEAALTEIDELDFDLENVNPAEPEDVSIADVPGNEEVAGGDNVTNLQLHLDKDSGLEKILPQDTFYTENEQGQAAQADATGNEDDNWLGDIDDALSFLDMPDEEIDLHEAHISTKLDLARAYLDMGDIEGARSTLEEVMVEGNDNQRKEAETLLHQTG